MAADVETMFYTREKPWHGLGVKVADALSSAEALAASGLGWKVVQKEILTEDGEPVPGFKANVRIPMKKSWGSSQTATGWCRMRKLLHLRTGFWAKACATRRQAL